MIFKENSSSSNELILPPITSSKTEIPSNPQSQEEKVDKEEKKDHEQHKESLIDTDISKNPESNSQSVTTSQNLIKTNKTQEINKIENNRYKLQDNQTIPEENTNNISEDNKKTQEKARTLSIIRSLTNNDNPYIARVILENVRSLKDCIFLLENYLKANNIQTHYETSNEQDKIIFMFAEEKIAFEFTKIIYTEKNKNYLYKNVKVNFSLEPNQTYLKRQRAKNRKKGLSYESIMQLYQGSSYVKKVKEFPEIIGNKDLGMKSPFYVVNLHRKKNKNNTSKHIKFKSYDFNKNNIGGYIGYDGNPLKSYEKQKISVLDTHYKPFSSVNYRDVNKNKWLCPNNFKLY